MSKAINFQSDLYWFIGFEMLKWVTETALSPDEGNHHYEQEAGQDNYWIFETRTNGKGWDAPLFLSNRDAYDMSAKM